MYQPRVDDNRFFVGTPICISVINMKGGVGKTTVAGLLARDFARRGLKTLAIDLDPQANLSQSLMRYGYRQILDGRVPSIVDVFKKSRHPYDVVRHLEGKLHIIPSKFDFSEYLIDSIKPDAEVLSHVINSYFWDKELVIIDCAPTESIFTQAAYHASQFVLVPVRPEFFATIGFPLLNDSLDNFRKDNPNHKIDVIGVVINNSFYDGGNDGGPEKARAMDEIYEEANKNGWDVFENQLPHSRGFPKMMRGDYRHLGNAARDFPPFADEFMEVMSELV